MRPNLTSTAAICLAIAAGNASAIDAGTTAQDPSHDPTRLTIGTGISLLEGTERESNSQAQEGRRLATLRAKATEDDRRQKWVFKTGVSGLPEQTVRRKPGKVSVYRAHASIDGVVPVTKRHSLLLGYEHESSFWEFDNFVITPRFFGVPVDGRGVFIDARATDSVTKYTTTDTIKLGVDNKLTDEWSLEYGGTYSLSRDPAGDFDSSQYGSGRFIVHNHLSEDFSIGLGVEVETRLFRTPIWLPAIIVDWQIDPITHFSTGTRSIAITREVSDTFTFGADVAWELRQYRLPHDGIFAPLDAFTSFSVVNNQVPLPGFSLEELTIPARVHGRWQIGDNTVFTAFVGATLYREIKLFFPDNWDRVGAQAGQRLESFEFDPMFIGGFGIEITN